MFLLMHFAVRHRGKVQAHLAIRDPVLRDAHTQAEVVVPRTFVAARTTYKRGSADFLICRVTCLLTLASSLEVLAAIVRTGHD
jgi:hypothetical protein